MQAPTKYLLTININTAKALVAHADEVIE